jgi:hypothetical protein
MAGLIVACWRDRSVARFGRAELELVAARLSPDNSLPAPPRITTAPGIAVAVVNPRSDAHLHDEAACIGALLRPHDGWRRPGAPAPDGTFVLCRHDEDAVEVATDTLASRTLWYYADDEVFLASTSQRAVVTLLGDLDFNHRAVAWLASSGALGPLDGWDRRLRRLPGDTVLRLDRRSWRVSQRTRAPEPPAAGLSDVRRLEDLCEAILETCAALDVPLAHWLLPLSGGQDSRTILYAMRDVGRRPTCVTWGLSAALSDETSDAVVAGRLAADAGVTHSFLPTDYTDEPVRDVLLRFLVAGEGRVEEVGGYTDGLEVWRALVAADAHGVIRGDEPGWGYHEYFTEEQVRREAHLSLVADHPRGHPIHELGLEEQEFPAVLRRERGESFFTFIDRMTRSVDVPIFFAALTDIKAAYLEVANPFLTNRVVSAARNLSDTLRRDMNGFSAVAAAIGPDIPLAKHKATAGAAAYLNRQEFIAELSGELSSPDAERVLRREALDQLLTAMGGGPTAVAPKSRLRKAVRRLTPERAAQAVIAARRPVLDTKLLALRIYLASRMAALLGSDAAALGRPARAPGR